MTRKTNLPAASGPSPTPALDLALAFAIVAFASILAGDQALAADPFSWANQKLTGVRSTALTFLNTAGFFALVACVVLGFAKKQGWPFSWAGGIFGGLLLVNGYQLFQDWFTS